MNTLLITGWVRILLLALLAAAAAGCASPARFQPATGAASFAPYEGEVRVLENMPASNQFDRVGVVTVEGVWLTKDVEMIAAIKREAARHGANAVVMQSPVKATRNPAGGTDKRLAAWAIRLKR